MNYQTVLQNYHPTEQGDFMLKYEIGMSFIHRRKIHGLVSNCIAFPNLLLGNWHLYFHWICGR